MLKSKYIESSHTIYASIHQSEAIVWFLAKVGEADDDDKHSLSERLDDFLEYQENELTTYLNNGGTFSDNSVDQEEYMQHCFDEL